MNVVIEKENIKIESMIYEIRGKQVMFDSDLAKLYRCKNGTKEINQAVKNNPDKFPNDFCLKLIQSDIENLWSKKLTANINSKSRTLPTVFTEQGIYMLATILKGEVATQVTIAIMETFVAMRKYISTNLLEQKYINNQVMKNTEDIKLLQESFSKLEEKKKVNEIYFNGQIYDAYSKIYEIFNESKKELIIVDSYADNTILDIVKRLNVKVILITKSDNLLTNQDISKYKKQYNNLKVYYDNTFHDRYFIIDGKVLYHCGSSINRIGYKTFSINLINDRNMLDNLLDKINNCCH